MIGEEDLRFIFVRSNFGLDADDDPNLLDFQEFVSYAPESLKIQRPSRPDYPFCTVVSCAPEGLKNPTTL